MKFRKNFVSNSSSSSFIVPLAALTTTQKILIIEHSIYAKNIYEDCKNEENRPDLSYSYDAWNITEENEQLTGWTMMDNFDMREWMEQIGVPMGKVEWDNGHFCDNPFNEDK